MWGLWWGWVMQSLWQYTTVIVSQYGNTSWPRLESENTVLYLYWSNYRHVFCFATVRRKRVTGIMSLLFYEDTSLNLCLNIRSCVSAEKNSVSANWKMDYEITLILFTGAIPQKNADFGKIYIMTTYFGIFILISKNFLDSDF